MEQTQAQQPQMPKIPPAAFQRDYRLGLPNVHGDMNRFISLATHQDGDVLTDAMLSFKNELLQRMPLLFNGFIKSVVITVVDGPTGRVDLVIDGGRRDVYIKVKVDEDRFNPVPIATLMYGERNASSVDMFNFDPDWFQWTIANPAKLAVLMYAEAINKLLNDCWNEQTDAEVRITRMAKLIATQRAQLQAQAQAEAQAKAQAQSEAPAEQKPKAQRKKKAQEPPQEQ